MFVPGLFNDYLTDTLFDDVFNTPSTNGYMNADIQEFDDHYLMDFELPGFKKENIKCDLKNGYLTITATRKEDSKANFIRHERFVGEISRTFYVGEQVEQKDIKAKYNDGILTIEVPKKKKVEVLDDKQYISID